MLSVAAHNCENIKSNMLRTIFLVKLDIFDLELP